MQRNLLIDSEMNVVVSSKNNWHLYTVIHKNVAVHL